MPTKTPIPSFLTTARAFYGPAFDHKKKKALARSMAEWTEMDEAEQSFAHAHLLYLNLQAQAATQKLIGQVRDLLDEVAESLAVALEASMPDADEDDEPELTDVDDDDEEPFDEAPAFVEPEPPDSEPEEEDPEDDGDADDQDPEDDGDDAAEVA